MPALPPIIKAENAPNDNVQNDRRVIEAELTKPQ